MAKLSKNLQYTKASWRFFLKGSILYLRTTVNGDRGPDRTTGIKVTKATWDSKVQLVKPNDPESRQKNEQLVALAAKLGNARHELERKGETITARKLIKLVFDGSIENVTLGEVFRQQRLEMRATKVRSERTYQTYDRYLNNVSQYFAETREMNPLLEDIDSKDFRNLIAWLRKKYSYDYADKNAQYLRSLFNYALANGMIDRNPLTTIRLEKSGNYDTTSLSQEEVRRLAQYDFQKLSLPADSIRVLDEERDAFVFSAFSGLHHEDYHRGQFKVKLHNGRKWLFGNRVKSAAGKLDKPYQMPLHPLAIAIINKYDGIENLPKRNNAKRNVTLKQIAAYVGLDIHLTTKIARKTLASYCLNDLGMREETVAAVLGQKSTKFLKHYAKINNDSIDREMVFLPPNKAN